MLALTAFSGATSNKPRGLVLIPLLHKNYPIERAYEILKDLQNPAFAFDSLAFGSTWAHFDSLVTRLSGGSKSVTVIVYGDCGACRAPRRPAGLFKVVAPKLNISQLNKALARTQRVTVGSFVKHFADVEHRLKILPNVKYYFTISLEDNLSPQSFKVLEAIAKQVFALRDDVVISRSKQTANIQHSPKEYHSYSMNELGYMHSGDVVTGDGDTIRLADRTCGKYSVDQVVEWMERILEIGAIPLLWTPEMNGLPACQTSDRSVTTGPNKRHYAIPNLLKDILK